MLVIFPVDQAIQNPFRLKMQTSDFLDAELSQQKLCDSVLVLLGPLHTELRVILLD